LYLCSRTGTACVAIRRRTHDHRKQLEQKCIEQGIEKGIELGEQRGIEKGEREATLKIARTMLQNGLDCNTVMKMTGLSEYGLAQIPH
jgi:predicted transposase/invertase (TIGR01784 family)